MENYKCAIIDDEDYAIATLTEHIKQIPGLKLVKSFTDPIQALAEIKLSDRIDILFIDIDMPGLSGIELASMLRDYTNLIVFTTAHSQYAIDAFGIHADDYLVKPIGSVKFINSIRRLIEKRLSKSIYQEKDILFIRLAEKNRILKLYIEDILFIQALKNYVRLNVSGGITHDMKNTMGNAERELANTKLMRVHRSYIINLDKIQHVLGNSIKISDNNIIPIGNEYKEAVMKYAEKNLIRSGR
ncbi:response regulator transcription factor [Pedobacter frigidisoli]|uniref:Response regulator transcription factor n=1 Tax=Pedobacter frigidisoli TaxID=2530455 RepID=A0A4R0NYY3_9SPHI|nr:LytTR family DNA-binding domain-containing protein [Pedobacter frigidisoli]TCD07669.1 response regulator transcription factor [Pedobacter frigidisoli]